MYTPHNKRGVLAKPVFWIIYIIKDPTLTQQIILYMRVKVFSSSISYFNLLLNISKSRSKNVKKIRDS